MPLDGAAGQRRDNFTPLAALDWQVQVYGDPSNALSRLCEQRGLPLHAFGWVSAMQGAGFAPNALHLVRPDGYVALADRHASATTLQSYLDARGLTPLAIRTDPPREQRITAVS